VDGQSLQYSGCKFFKSSKFEANLIHVIDAASVELFSVTYLGLHLVRKCETQQTCKQTVKQLSWRQRFTHHISWICHQCGHFFWITWMKPMVCEMVWKKSLFKGHLGSRSEEEVSKKWRTLKIETLFLDSLQLLVLFELMYLKTGTVLTNLNERSMYIQQVQWTFFFFRHVYVDVAIGKCKSYFLCILVIRWTCFGHIHCQEVILLIQKSFSLLRGLYFSCHE